ncbi:MAG: resolvase [Cyanothece sp. SIO1E1]|nr:resolvase [Cyanothece sp. SIO1E1]
MSRSVETDPDGLMNIDTVQKVLNRSRASVYRYANTEDPENPKNLNPPYDPQSLNPELRNDKEDPLLFHPNEVARFAKDILGIEQVIIKVQQPPDTVTQALLKSILAELQSIHQLLESRHSI